jgi:hypothetical protein
MSEPSTQPRSDHNPPDADASAPSETEQGEGFSTAEKVLGAAAVYKAPLASSVVASVMLRDETDPARRRQLMQFRSAAFVWLAVGAVAFLIGIIVVASLWSSSSGGGGCKGGPEPWNAVGAQYRSSDNIHWTATVPCFGNGYTDVPVPAGALP